MPTASINTAYVNYAPSQWGSKELRLVLLPLLGPFTYLGLLSMNPSKPALYKNETPNSRNWPT